MGKTMDKDTRFCDSLYLIGLKNLLLNDINSIRLTDKYLITTELTERKINPNMRYASNDLNTLYATICVMNEEINKEQYILKIRKHNEMLTAVGVSGVLTYFKNMSDYQKLRFILDLDKTSVSSRARYCCATCSGDYDRHLYRLTVMQAEKQYKELILLNERVRKVYK